MEGGASLRLRHCPTSPTWCAVRFTGPLHHPLPGVISAGSSQPFSPGSTATTLWTPSTTAMCMWPRGQKGSSPRRTGKEGHHLLQTEKLSSLAELTVSSLLCPLSLSMRQSGRSGSTFSQSQLHGDCCHGNSVLLSPSCLTKSDIVTSIL